MLGTGLQVTFRICEGGKGYSFAKYHILAVGFSQVQGTFRLVMMLSGMKKCLHFCNSTSHKGYLLKDTHDRCF